jgi:iron complex outermembrane receptor protein
MSRKTGRNAYRKATKQLRATATRPTCSTVGISGFALGAFALSGPLFAQDATPANPKDNNSKDNVDALQEVVVTGIRASLQRSLDIKQQAVGVEDAISAEDIGQFPDASIGEAIARIPGVTVNRGSINASASAGAPTSTGQVTGVTVRGFGTQFNELLSNGRPIASGNGQNFDFSALGAEYVGEVDVHKTPDFSLSSGAIGASIDIKSPNPFDHPGMQARFFGSGTDYQKDGGVTPAFGALFSDTFADDTIGILVAGDYTTKHVDGDHFDIVGWKGATLNSCQMVGGPACTTDSKGNYTTPANSYPSWYPQDQAMYLERTDSRRKDGRLALQWHPADNVLITLDDNYSSDSEVTDRWQYSTWFGCMPASCTNVSQNANGTITNFTNSNAPTDFNAMVSQTYIVTNTPGLNVKWDINDQWTTGLDVSQSESKLNPNGSFSDIDSDVGYGPNTALGTNGYTGGLAVPGGKNNLPYWTAVGPGATATGTGTVTSPNYLGLNPYIIGSHVFPIQTQVNTDKVNQIKLDGAWHSDATTVHFGAQFVDDAYSSKEYDTFTNNEWQLWSGYGPASNNFVYYCGAKACTSQTNPPAGATKVLHGVALPPGLFTPVSVSNFIHGFNGSNLPQSLLLYNPYAVLNYLVQQPINADYSPSAGYGPYTGGYPTPVLNTSLVQEIDRKNYSPFVTAQQNIPIDAMTLKVNVGLRWQRTEETISGLQTPLQSLGLEPGDVTAYQFNVGPAQNTTAHQTYSYFLPSLDLNLLVKPNLKVRADFSRTETAPNNNDIFPNVSYTGRVNALSATGNNPYLRPYLADNYDLGAEWYYAENDYVSVDGFFKHVTQFPVSSVQTITVPGVYDTSPLSANQGKLAQFAETTFINGLAANVTGVEATWQQMLAYGFGFQVNGTYAHSNSNFNPYSTVTNQFALPGVGNSANLIAFYQQNGFQARLALQWQAKQLLQLGQEQNGGAFGNEPTYLDSSTELDFSSSYEVNSHLSVFFEALNLTDQVYKTVGRFDNQTLNVVDYGRSFTFGVRAKL